MYQIHDIFSGYVPQELKGYMIDSLKLPFAEITISQITRSAYQMEVSQKTSIIDLHNQGYSN